HPPPPPAICPLSLHDALPIYIRERDTPPFALVNPEIIQRSEELARDEEGCLSIPGLKDIVERPARVVVEGLDRDGIPRRIEAEGDRKSTRLNSSHVKIPYAVF